MLGYMSTAHVPISRLTDAIRQVCLTLEQSHVLIESRPMVSEDDLWRELVACVLGSRVRFDAVHAAMDRMNDAGLFLSARRSAADDQYEEDVLNALLGTASASETFTGFARYPFPRVRARQIRDAARRLYTCCGSIRCFLDNAGEFRAARRLLATEVPGLGPKQASLFLRNAGYALEVAILDVHILTYMNWMGLTSKPVRFIQTLRQYEHLEDAFIRHATSVGFSPHYYDMAVWVVVRVAKREHALWR